MSTPYGEFELEKKELASIDFKNAKFRVEDVFRNIVIPCYTPKGMSEQQVCAAFDGATGAEFKVPELMMASRGTSAAEVESWSVYDEPLEAFA